ncbi:hypothetical protein [Nocardia phage NBR1]|uniref:hypothetical protein n=1 Tax=Nocardia phage NBR1 TaxID=1109711 RepID=UPI00023EEDF8|nr:hypothetical protein NoPhNBR1_gp53 [Nocardia phage NBR1]AEV52266.1 hypothetical protein [Nocardia phage NBR1]
MIDLDAGLDWVDHDHILEFNILEDVTLPPNWSGGKAWIPRVAKVTVRQRPGDAAHVTKVEMLGYCAKKDGTAGQQPNSNWWHTNSYSAYPGWRDDVPEFVQAVGAHALEIVRKAWTA